MATLFTHAAVAIGVTRICFREKMPVEFHALAVACACLPDADVISFAFVPYEHMLGHRGLSHSLLFAVFVGFAVTLLCCRGVPRFSGAWWRMGLFFTLVTASHGVLDALTDGGEGVAFFAPFDNARHFFPWQPLVVSPIGVFAMFEPLFFRAIGSELLIVWLPLGVAAWWMDRRRRQAVASRGASGVQP